MKCKQCGDCCKKVYFPLFDRDHAEWALYHGFRCFTIEGTGEYRVMIERRCKKLQDNKCIIYDKRPMMCKAYTCEAVKDKYFKEIFL